MDAFTFDSKMAKRLRKAATKFIYHRDNNNHFRAHIRHKQMISLIQDWNPGTVIGWHTSKAVKNDQPSKLILLVVEEMYPGILEQMASESVVTDLDVFLDQLKQEALSEMASEERG